MTMTIPLTAVRSNDTTALVQTGKTTVCQRVATLGKITLCFLDLGAMGSLWATNYHFWGRNKLVDLTAFTCSGVALQVLVRVATSDEVYRALHNWNNRWLLELAEALGQVVYNLPSYPYIAFQVNAAGVCTLKAASVTRTFIAAFTEGHTDLHESDALEFRAVTIPMIQGPHNSVRWILLAEIVELTATGLLCGGGIYFKDKGLIALSQIMGGYALGISGRAFLQYKDWLQRRSLERMSYYSLNDTPDVGCAAGTLQRITTIVADAQGLILASLLASPYTLVAAGYTLRVIHDNRLRAFQSTTLPPNPTTSAAVLEKPGWGASIRSALKINNLIKTGLVLGMCGYIAFLMSQSEPPSIAALGAFTAALFGSYFGTYAIYNAFHQMHSLTHSRIIAELYYWSLVNTELAPFIFAAFRKAMQLNDTTLDTAPLPMRIAGIVGFLLFGWSWGSNTAVQGLASHKGGLRSPPFVAQFLLGLVITELYIEAIHDQFRH